MKAILEPARSASNNLDNKCVVPAALPFGLELMSFRDKRLTAELAESAWPAGPTTAKTTSPRRAESGHAVRLHDG